MLVRCASPGHRRRPECNRPRWCSPTAARGRGLFPFIERIFAENELGIADGSPSDLAAKPVTTSTRRLQSATNIMLSMGPTTKHLPSSPVRPISGMLTRLRALHELDNSRPASATPGRHGAVL